MGLSGKEELRPLFGAEKKKRKKNRPNRESGFTANFVGDKRRLYILNIQGRGKEEAILIFGSAGEISWVPEMPDEYISALKRKKKSIRLGNRKVHLRHRVHALGVLQKNTQERIRSTVRVTRSLPEEKKKKRGISVV